MAPGGPEEVPGWLMRHMGGAGQPMGHLDLHFPMFLVHLFIFDLRFPMFWGPRTLSLHPCAAKSPGGEFGLTSDLGFFIAFWLVAGTT